MPKSPNPPLALAALGAEAERESPWLPGDDSNAGLTAKTPALFAGAALPAPHVLTLASSPGAPARLSLPAGSLRAGFSYSIARAAPLGPCGET